MKKSSKQNLHYCWQSYPCICGWGGWTLQLTPSFHSAMSPCTLSQSRGSDKFPGHAWQWDDTEEFIFSCISIWSLNERYQAGFKSRSHRRTWLDTNRHWSVSFQKWKLHTCYWYSLTSCDAATLHHTCLHWSKCRHHDPVSGPPPRTLTDKRDDGRSLVSEASLMKYRSWQLPELILSDIIVPSYFEPSG